MSWLSFVQYVTMREMGQSDTVQRNYDVGNLNGSKPGVVLDRAYKLMGFDQANTARPFVLPSIRAHLFNVGFNAPDDAALQLLVREWYNWHRIRSGAVERWPRIAVYNPLL